MDTLIEAIRHFSDPEICIDTVAGPGANTPPYRDEIAKR
jgi:hypothetical protein